MPKRKLILDASLADKLEEYCESTFILPDDLVRLAIQQPIKEPFLIDARQVTGRDQTERMLRILSVLWKAAPDSFSKAAEGVHGHKRLWFSTQPTEITNSGSSNFSQKIGDSTWFVSTNCPHQGMRSRVEKIMKGMGFSKNYIWLVSSSISRPKGELLSFNFFED